MPPTLGPADRQLIEDFAYALFPLDRWLEFKVYPRPRQDLPWRRPARPGRRGRRPPADARRWDLAGPGPRAAPGRLPAVDRDRGGLVVHRPVRRGPALLPPGHDRAGGRFLAVGRPHRDGRVPP